MTKYSLGFLVLAVVSGPAWSMQRNWHLNQYEAVKLHPGHDDSQSKQCLRRKATGKVECRTVAQWQKLAQKMEQATAKKPD